MGTGISPSLSLALSETLAFFTDSLSRAASMISRGQSRVPPPPVMWFHSLRCGSIPGDFLCLASPLLPALRHRYAHLKPVRPALFDAQMSTVSQRKPWASGLRSPAAAAPSTSNKSRARVFESMTTAEYTAEPLTSSLPTPAANHLKPQPPEEAQHAHRYEDDKDTFHTRRVNPLITEKSSSRF